jgi:hypothetical protein
MNSILFTIKFKISSLFHRLYCCISKRNTAYHEAGHAVACFRLGVPFTEASIMFEFCEGVFECGHVDRPNNYLLPRKKNETPEQFVIRRNHFLESCIISEFCGGIAENKFSGSFQENSSYYDSENVYDLIDQMKIPDEAKKKVYEQCKILANKFVTDNWDDITRIAKKLLNSLSHKLSYEEIRRVID